MFAVGDGIESDGGVREVWRGDDDGVNVFAFHDVFVAGGSNGCTGLLTGAFKSGSVRIAQGDNLHVRAQGETGQMILQCNAATADNGDVERLRWLHGPKSMATLRQNAQSKVVG